LWHQQPIFLYYGILIKSVRNSRGISILLVTVQYIYTVEFANNQIHIEN
jgi:hypothetical protein